MPYIRKERREKWEEPLKKVKDITSKLGVSQVEGELNFFITSLLKQTYKQSYFEYNRAIGLLESIKQEYYRKEVAPYENKKEGENGSV